MGKPHSQSGRLGTEKSLAAVENRTPDGLARSLVPILITTS